MVEKIGFGFGKIGSYVCENEFRIWIRTYTYNISIKLHPSISLVIQLIEIILEFMNRLRIIGEEVM